MKSAERLLEEVRQGKPERLKFPTRTVKPRAVIPVELYEKLVVYSIRKYNKAQVTRALIEALELFFSVVEGKVKVVPVSEQLTPASVTPPPTVEAQQKHVATSKKKPEDAVAQFIRDNPWVAILSRRVAEAEQAGEA